MTVIFFVLLMCYTGLVNGLCTISDCTDNVFVNYTCTCTRCNNGYYRFSASACRNCFFNCRTCGNSYCLSPVHSDCKAFVIDTCSSQGCSQNTIISCPSCPDGYYWHRGWCIRCITSGCKCSSTETDNCLGCLPGRYGKVCNETCPVGCKTCRSSSYCTECSQGKYGITCDRDCPSTCSDGVCEQISGICCNGAYYLAFNNATYAYECKHCPENCAACKSTTHCMSCKLGHWGTYCQHNCTGCSTNCSFEGCISCQNSYYNQRISDGYECIKCLNNCKSCSSRTTCDECEDGYISHDDKCFQSNFSISCPINCKNGTCDQFDGACIEGCLNGWSGANCSTKCSPDCEIQPCLKPYGSCITGSTASISGTSKTTASDNLSTQPLPLKASNVAVPVGAGAAAVVVIVVVIFFTVLFLRRRRTRRKSQENNVPLENANDTMGKDGNVYATISDSDDELSDVQILSEKSEAVAAKAPPYQNENIEKSDENNFADGETKTAHTPVIAKPMIDSDVSDSEKAVSPTIPTESLKADDDLVSKEEKEGEEPTNGENTSDKSYYNTLGKRVPVSSLSDYVHNKNHDDLVEEFYKLPRGLQKDHNAAKSSRNASKNRYKAIYPYDESRVILKDGGNDYINASYIKGYNKPNEYIASSGPFKRGTTNVETVSDFWRMVWQEKCETILMLTNCWENTERKCEQYWPELGNSNTYANISVTCFTEDTYADFTIRSFVVNKDDESLNARQLHFTAWPDKGVPADVTSMIEYRQKVRSLHKDETCPLLVHCSAGIGRTGTFIALDLLTFKGIKQEYVDVFGCVSDLRSQRVNLVQTPEQYKYLHHALLHSLTFDCQSITAEKFIETYSKLIKKKEGIREIESQFKRLQTNLESLSADDKTARERNRALTDQNRESADIPGDENRVRLFENRKPDETDYINAVYINGFRSRNRFIVAQTPLPTTVVDFLSMIFQVKCSFVVAMEETDLQDQTVAVYWPADNQVIKHGVFQVRCKESRTTPNYTLKSLLLIRRLGKNEEKHEFDLFIFTNWPCNAAVPTSSDSLLQIMKDVDTRNHHPDEEIPILVHCMTAAERSCLYCAVSVLIEKMEIEHEVSVVNTLRQIKARRRSAIPTLAQYKFCHQAVISYLQTFDIYSNFGLKSTESTESLNE